MSDVIVVGAGPAGMTVAHTLLQAAPGRTVTILEADHRPGGQIVTEVRDGYTFEHGATALVGGHPETWQLLTSLGLRERVEPAATAARTTRIWHRGRLHPVPSSVPAALRTTLLTPRAKLRVLTEPLLGRSGPRPGESLHDLVARRFGPEPAEVLLGALVQGITAGDPRHIGPGDLMPGLADLDRDAGDGSLLLHALRRQRARQVPADAGPTGPVTLHGGGLEVLVQALATRLGDRLRCGQEVHAITPGDRRRYRLTTASGTVVEADTVVVAIPAHRAAQLLADLAPATAQALGTIEYADLRVLGLGIPRSAFTCVPPGLGFLSPPGQGLNLIGATVSSNAFEEQAPPGHLLVRVFTGGVFAPRLVEMPTQDAVRLVTADLRRVLGLHADPTFVRDAVWRKAIPQYSPSHGVTVERARAGLSGLPGVHLIGNSYRGPGIAATIRDATGLGLALADEQPVPHPALRSGQTQGV